VPPLKNTILTRPAAQFVRMLLTTREAASALAVSPRLLWTLTHRGELPCLRLPGRGKARAIRYDVRDLLAWIDRQKAISPPNEVNTNQDL